MTLKAVTVFGVPVKGSHLTPSAAAFLFVLLATGFGLIASSFTRRRFRQTVNQPT